jgi:hypothetical protein
MKTYRCVFKDGSELMVVSSDKARAILTAKELSSSVLVNVFIEGEW